MRTDVSVRTGARLPLVAENRTDAMLETQSYTQVSHTKFDCFSSNRVGTKLTWPYNHRGGALLSHSPGS